MVRSKTKEAAEMEINYIKTLSFENAKAIFMINRVIDVKEN